MARPRPWLAPAVLAGTLAPALLLALDWAGGRLGAEPAVAAMRSTGLLALVLLLAGLACSPLRAVLGWTWPMRLRRQLGLTAFAYVLGHLGLYAVAVRGLDVVAALEDVAERPFILAGTAALALLVPLAATSTDASVRRLGFVRWQALHRLVYPAVALAVLHYLLQPKVVEARHVVAAGVLGGLLAVRVVLAARRRARAAGRPAR